jgi:hypothetical protein
MLTKYGCGSSREGGWKIISSGISGSGEGKDLRSSMQKRIWGLISPF